MTPNLTPVQLQTLKAHIAANTNVSTAPGAYLNTPINQIPNNADGNQAIAYWYNLVIAVAFWAWKTNVIKSDIYRKSSDLPSLWDWTIFKNQTVAEQNAWNEIFMGGGSDFSSPNVRTGISTIFSGSATPQANHCFAMGRRAVTNIERLYTTGTGSTASPATMASEGPVSPQTIEEARTLP